MTNKNEVTVIDAEAQIGVFADLTESDQIRSLSYLENASKELIGVMNIDLTRSTEEKWLLAEKHKKRSAADFAAYGLYLLSIKEGCEHGAFLPELERHGIEERDAQRAMAYARYVFTQQATQQERLVAMPVNKVLTLAKADPEVVEVLMEDGETVEQTTVRGLVEMLQAKTRKEKAWAERIARAERETEGLRKRLQPVSDFNERTEVVRHSCVLLQQETDTALGSLQRTFDEVAAAPLAPEYEYQVQQLALTAQVVLARATALVLHMQALDDVQRLWPQEVRPHHLMTEGEAARWLSEAAHLSETQKARVAVATRAQDATQTAKAPKAKANKPAGGKA